MPFAMRMLRPRGPIICARCRRGGTPPGGGDLAAELGHTERR